MKSKTQLLVLFLLLLVIPTSTLLACGNSSEKVKIEKKSCSKENRNSEKKACCDNQDNNKDGCDRTCDNTSCHCPSSVNIPVLFNNFQLLKTNHFILLNNSWTYVQHIPKAVHLTIWQPPKIS